MKSCELVENQNPAAGMLPNKEAKLASVGTNGQDLRSRKGSPLENPDQFNLPVWMNDDAVGKNQDPVPGERQDSGKNELDGQGWTFEGQNQKTERYSDGEDGEKDQ